MFGPAKRTASAASRSQCCADVFSRPARFVFLLAAQRVSARASPAAAAASVVPRKVLIVNTNGGGHANIGFWLAKTLAAQGHQVTLNVVGEQDDKKMQKPPFSYFGELTSAGVRTVWANPGDLASKASGENFDVVVDNNGKDLDSVGPVADFAVAAGASQFFFVSSAGMYKPTATPPHLEGDAVKESAGHNQVESMLALLGLRRVEDRVRGFMELLARDFGEPCDDGLRLNLRLTHQEIASALSTTRVTVTRVLGQLRDEGWLQIDASRHLVMTRTGRH